MVLSVNLKEFEMNKTLIVIAALALSSPAYALTLEQAQNELGGMNCAGSTCTSKATETTSVTTITPGFYTRTGSSSQSDNAVASDKCMMGVIGKPGVRIQMPNVDANCTALSIASTGSGTYTPASSTTSTETICTTTSKTLSYNGPNTSRDTAWSIDTSTSSSGGAC